MGKGLEACMRKLLAVSWVMPPQVFPRSIQVARLLRAIRAFGWQSDVVCTQPESVPNAMLDQGLATFHEGDYRRHLIEPREEVQPSPPWLRALRRLRKPANILMSNWERRATSRLQRLVVEHSPDVLVSFAQPWVDHRIAGHIKRRFHKLPWIAHFSDPWTDSPYFRPASEEEFTTELVAERQVMQKADALVFVTEATRDLVMRKYPETIRRKSFVLPHIMQPGLRGDFAVPASAGMRLVYTGSFYPGMREPQAFLTVLAELLSSGQLPQSITVDFIGYAAPEAIEFSQRLALSNRVRFHGRHTYLESLAWAEAADALLVFDAPVAGSVFMPSKLVDYLNARKPLVGFTPRDGVTAGLLTRLGYRWAPPDDPEAIREMLLALMADFDSRRLSLSPGHVEVAAEFTPEHVAQRFSSILDQALSVPREAD
jgi:glycosyltransferase involved in cell wall biosynthesis